MQQSNTKPLQQTYHTTQTHLKSYVFLLCSFCWILPRGICIRCYNLLVAKYVTRPFVFSENPTQSLHQQRRSVHQCSEDVSMDCTMQQPSVSSAHSLRIERPRTFVSLFWKLISRYDAQEEGAGGFHLLPQLCLYGEKMGEKVTSVTVAHCNTFRLFVLNIVLPWPN